MQADRAAVWTSNRIPSSIRTRQSCDRLQDVLTLKNAHAFRAGRAFIPHHFEQRAHFRTAGSGPQDGSGYSSKRADKKRRRQAEFPIVLLLLQQPCPLERHLSPYCSPSESWPADRRTDEWRVATREDVRT